MILQHLPAALLKRAHIRIISVAAAGVDAVSDVDVSDILRAPVPVRVIKDGLGVEGRSESGREAVHEDAEAGFARGGDAGVDEAAVGGEPGRVHAIEVRDLRASEAGGCVDAGFAAEEDFRVEGAFRGIHDDAVGDSIDVVALVEHGGGDGTPYVSWYETRTVIWELL